MEHAEVAETLGIILGKIKFRISQLFPRPNDHFLLSTGIMHWGGAPPSSPSSFSFSTTSSFCCCVFPEEEEEEYLGGLLDEDFDEKNEFRIAEANEDVLIVGDIVMVY